MTRNLIVYKVDYVNKQEDYVQTDPSMNFRSKRDPLYKALYGLGTLTESWLIRKGNLVGGTIGIIKKSDRKFSKRLNE